MTDTPRKHSIREMAVILCGVAELGSDDACVQALMAAGYQAREIARHLDTAREMARAARAGEAELWSQLWHARNSEQQP